MRCPQIDIDTAQVTRQLFPPRMEKLSTSMDFYAANFTAALTGGVGDEVEICSFQVLDGMVGYVQQMNIYVLQPTPAARVAFALRVGNSPVSGFSEIQNPPCAAAMTYVPRNNLQIRAGLGQRISLIGRNLGGGALTIGGEIAGWIHPETAEALAWGLSL